jgi:hypothetical protein
VLSGTESRRHYDAARANRADATAQATAAADAEQARRQAADYPRSWPEFERWLTRTGTDFSRARYSSGDFGPFHLPVVRGSVTGWVFIVGGGIVGAALAGWLVIDAPSKGNGKALLVIAGAAGGTWVFAWVHRQISDTIKETRAKAAARAADPSPPSNPPPESAPETRILACGQCGQKLRVPKMDAHMRVTCTTCRHQFWLSPEPGAAPESPPASHTTNCPACGSSLWNGSECGACGHGKVSGYRKRHPAPPKREPTPGDMFALVAGAVLVLGFFGVFAVWLIAGLGEAWGNGKSRSFTENLKVGVVLVVVVGTLTWIWHKRQQKPQ